MQPADFDYQLPQELIARFPADERRGSRLLVVDAPNERLLDTAFEALPHFLEPGDLLVFNDTRVINARLRGRKETGGGVEILIERITAPATAIAQVSASKRPRQGSLILLAEGHTATISGRAGAFHELAFSAPLDELLARIGEVPLPPYLGRDATPADRERYQTVYARHEGAVAAPTAGLHFDEAMLEETRASGIRHASVTLHVGAGTFQPLREEALAARRLHPERVRVDSTCCDAVRSTRAAGGRVVAVGTTSVRALEAAAATGAIRPFDGETDLFIVPGFRFRSVDRLLTNFHLPRSSLLMLVAAFAGRDRILHAYRHAVAERYRFFSYGDAMLVIPPDDASSDDAAAG